MSALEQPLGEGDRVELPGERSTYEVVESHQYAASPDRYEVAEVDGSQRLTWRGHHVERALEARAVLHRGAGTGDRFDVLARDAA